MTDRKIVDEQPEETGRLGSKDGWARGSARGLHLRQIEEPVEGEAYEGVGVEMRAERQRRQLSLIDVATTLRIQLAYLEALEDGRIDDLPGPTYAVGFLRTYSEFLGLDGDEIIRQFKQEATLAPVEGRLVFPEPLEEARRPGLSLALISLLVAGAVYGGWIFLEQRDLVPIEGVAEPPQRLTPYQTATETAPWKPPSRVDNTAPAGSEAGTATAPPSPEAAPGTPSADQPSARTAETGETPAVAPPASALAEPSGSSASGQPADQGAAGNDEETAQTAAGTTQGSDEGERAAAADVSGLANADDESNGNNAAPEADRAVSIGDIPSTTKLAARGAASPVEASDPSPVATLPGSATEPAAEQTAGTSSTVGPDGQAAAATSNNPPESLNASDAVNRPADGEPAKPVEATEQVSPTQPVARVSSSSAPSLREGSDVDTAPAMPSDQAAITPPPPPAAPAAPARPLSEGGSEEIADGSAEGLSRTAATGSLGYFQPRCSGCAAGTRRILGPGSGRQQ